MLKWMGIEINTVFKKTRGKICSLLAKYPVTHKWPTFWFRKCGYSIGENVLFGADCLIWAWNHLDTDKIKIEDNVSIGPKVILIIRSHSPSQIEKYGMVTNSIAGYITIEKGAWIGAGAIILPNVTIGKCSVVGAGAVVTKNVSPYTVVAGVPAKVIKHLKVAK